MNIQASMSPSVKDVSFVPSYVKGDTTCRSVEISQIERVGMVCFPGREEHRQAWYQSCKDAFWRVSQPHSSRLE